MRSNICVMNSAAAAVLLSCAGCAHNHWVEDSPSARVDWNSPTAADVYARMSAGDIRVRDWPAQTPKIESGMVAHSPLYFEDPFEDKGSGHDGQNKYRIGWEDYVAMPYCLARHTLNWIGLPISFVVTPPCMDMESDGRLSRQILGYDHDATGAGAESKTAPVESPEKAGSTSADSQPQSG